MNARFVVILFGVLCSAFAAEPRWERLASLPVPNGGFVAAANNGRIVVAGGVTWRGDTKVWLDGIWTYDPAQHAWSESGRLPALHAYPVVGSAGAATWYAGGSSGEATHRTLWRLGGTGVPRRGAEIGVEVVYAAGALIGDTLYAVGGTDDQARVDRITNTLIGIDVLTGTVSTLPSYPEVNLTSATAATLGGRLYVFGGGRWDPVRKSVVNHASAHAYSPDTRAWEKLPPLPHPVRGLASAALNNRFILIAGGYRNDEVEFVADAFLFDPRSRTYSPVTPLPYAAMATLVRDGDWLYCLGGEDRKRHRTDAVFRIRWRSLLPRS